MDWRKREQLRHIFRDPNGKEHPRTTYGRVYSFGRFHKHSDFEQYGWFLGACSDKELEQFPDTVVVKVESCVKQ